MVLTQVINGYFTIEGEKCGKQTSTFSLTVIDNLNVPFNYKYDVTWLTDEDREIFVALSVMIQGI